ncbi:MAG: hypothetical protein SGBAC_011142, partial [Bacillariaceae sp.]
MVKNSERKRSVADETDGDGDPLNDDEQNSHTDNGADLFDCVTQDGYYQKVLSPTQRWVARLAGCFLMSFWLYILYGGVATNEITEEIIITKTTNTTKKDSTTTGSGTENVTKRDYGLHEGLLSNYPFISINSKDGGVQSSPVGSTPPTGDGGKCPALCDSREQARNSKFGGDLLDLSDVLQMANKAHDKLVDHIKLDYGEYFDGIFINEQPASNATTKPKQYSGIQPVTPDGGSRNRLKRKLQLKVLKMMEALKISEEDVHGCNCRTKTGSPTTTATATATATTEDFTSSIPRYWQSYVFANGGHSNAAGHGNVFSQTYTHYIGEDLRIIWDALGVEMINRNMGMGAMKASPDISTCSQEIFGNDLDLLTWNYAMTDKSFESWLHYVYRGAVNPGRPAFVTMDSGHLYEKYGAPLEEMGLSLWWLNGASMPTNEHIPDSAPEGIPLTDDELKELPPMVKGLKCDRRMEGEPTCSNELKWSCTSKMRKARIKCTCPGVRKRSGWHMGFKRHALEAHYMSLPIVEMLLEGLSELVATGKDPKTLYQELQKEEDDEFEAFLSIPIKEKFNSD